MIALNGPNFPAEAGVRLHAGLYLQFRPSAQRRLELSLVNISVGIPERRNSELIGQISTPRRSILRVQPILREFDHLWSSLDPFRPTSANSGAVSGNFWRTRHIIRRFPTLRAMLANLVAKLAKFGCDDGHLLLCDFG